MLPIVLLHLTLICVLGVILKFIITTAMEVSVYNVCFVVLANYFYYRVMA